MDGRHPSYAVMQIAGSIVRAVPEGSGRAKWIGGWSLPGVYDFDQLQTISLNDMYED